MRVPDVEAIGWDFDNTCIDSMGVFLAVAAEMAGERDLAVPDLELVRHNYSGSLEESLGNTFGVDGPVLAALVEDFLRYQEAHYTGDLDTHLFSDAVALAQRAAARSLPQLIVTNREHVRAGVASPRLIVAATALNACIQDFRCGDEVTHRKPDPRCIADWMEERAVPPEGLLIIGDQGVDGRLAVNIGARAVLVARHEDGTIPHMEELATHPDIYVVRSLDEVELV